MERRSKISVLFLFLRPATAKSSSCLNWYQKHTSGYRVMVLSCGHCCNTSDRRNFGPPRNRKKNEVWCMMRRSDEWNDLYLIQDTCQPKSKPAGDKKILKITRLLLSKFFHFETGLWHWHKQGLSILFESPSSRAGRFRTGEYALSCKSLSVKLYFDRLPVNCYRQPRCIKISTKYIALFKTNFW